MTSREKILERVKQNHPLHTAVNTTEMIATTFADPRQKFEEMFASIGGKIIRINRLAEVESYLQSEFQSSTRVISAIPGIVRSNFSDNPGSYADVLVCVLEGAWAVAENASIWISDKMMPDRVLPFICEHLILVVNAANVISNMYEAYDVIDSNYEYGTFIAGPSKTADIEQSLVLGAHGPKSLTVFLLNKEH